MIVLFWILLGFALGYLLGMNHTDSATFVSNYRRMELDNKHLQDKVDRYKGIVKELVENNKSLVKELERK